MAADSFLHDICAYNHELEAFLAALMHMKPNQGHIPMNYYHLEPMKPLYMVRGALGIQFFGFKK